MLTWMNLFEGHIFELLGPVAQRITRLTTNQEIAGSNPAWIINFFYYQQL